MRILPASRTRRLLLVGGSLAAIAVVAWLGWGRFGAATDQASLTSLRQDIVAGKPGSSRAAMKAAMKDWSTRPQVIEMLRSDHWQERSVACEILGGRDEARLLPLLVQAASDSDWRVRASAFEALMRIHRPDGLEPPHQNTPLDAREQILLAWLDSYDRRTSGGLASRLCEIHAFSRHAEFGRPVAQRCLNCHAGSPPASPQAAEGCASCHASIVDQWSRSAHANSLSHLKLATVDETSRTPGIMSFDPVKGINCSQCHGAVRAAGATVAAASSPHAGGPAETARGSCGACHASIRQQWKTWQSTPHMRRAVWPPGEIEAASSEDRTCADCHMPPVSRRPVRHSHDWACRRDAELLASACDVALVAQRSGDAMQLKLTVTNLSGHDFPTGTCRRAIRIELAPDAAAVQTVAVLSQPDAAGASAGQAPLAPGEARTFTITVSADAQAATVALTFVRNFADPEAYRIKFLTRTFDIKQVEVKPPAK